MPDEKRLNPLTANKDSKQFWEQSVPKVRIVLNKKLREFRNVLETKDSGQIAGFFLKTADDLNRAVADAEENEDIFSDSNRVIIHDSGLVFWKKPADVKELNHDLNNELASALINDKIDKERFGKGVYFLTVLLDKYNNGNGRTAKGLKAIVDKADSGESFTEDEIRTILGEDREIIADKDRGQFSIYFNPDWERLVLGVCYFALQRKGLSVEQIINKVGLNGKLPENGLELLAQELKTDPSQPKTEYIRFMAVDSALEWCNF